MLDYIGSHHVGQTGSPDATFSLNEAAYFLDLPARVVERLAVVPGVCAKFATTGRISETAIRHIHAKLSSQVV